MEKRKNNNPLTPRMRVKRAVRTFLLLLLCLILYFAIGAASPFIRLRDTGSGSGDVAQYMSESEGPERAVVLEENTDALDWRLRLIAEAKTEIFMTSYQFKTGKSCDLLAAAFFDAADRGVSVRIMVDGLSGVTNMEGETFFEALSVYPGIEVRLYNRFEVLRPWSCNGRLHDKCFVIDDVAYIAGGRNTFDYFLGDFPTDGKSYDREVLVYNTAHGTDAGETASIHRLRDYFYSIWDGGNATAFRDRNRDPGSRRMTEEYARIRAFADSVAYPVSQPSFDELCRSATVATNRVSVIHGEIGIFGKNPVLWSEMKQIMMTARERVVIQSPYIMCGDAMYDDLRDIVAAVPELRMVTNSMLNTDNRFSPADYYYHQDDILDTGVRIFEFDGEYSTHAKTVLVDDRLTLIGSFNLDLRSVYMDTEMMVVIDSEELNAEATGYLDEILESSREVGEGNTVRERIKEAPFLKRVWWRIFGVILTPFRFEL